MGEWLQQFGDGLAGNFLDLSNGTQAGLLVGRVLLAVALGAALGYERELRGKPDGGRTHALIALAAAAFVLVPLRCGATAADVSRIVQGLAAGVGFLGAGAIIKPTGEGAVYGLTSAASIYFTTAVGVAAGLGHGLTAVLCTSLVLAVLTFLPKAEGWLKRRLGVIQAERKSLLLPPDAPLKPPASVSTSSPNANP